MEEEIPAEAKLRVQPLMRLLVPPLQLSCSVNCEFTANLIMIIVSSELEIAVGRFNGVL